MFSTLYVGVGLVVQAEVAVVLDAVHRLAQGAQHDGLDQVEIRAVGDLRQQGLVVLRRGILALVQRQAELAQESAQLFQALRRRAVVHPVQGRDLVLLEELGGGHVGRQHALLDQLVGIVAHGRADFRDLALGTEDDAGFLGLEVDRATAVAGVQEDLVDRVQALEVRQYFFVLDPQRAAFTCARMLEHAADLVVGQARMGVDHRLVELVVDHLAGLVHGHLADHGQAIDMRVQRAQAVGQLLGQHRHDALGEVHRVAAHLGFVVQGRAQADIAGNVGDRHVEAPAAGEHAQLAERFAIDRVVEVTSVFTVDGDERQVTQVDALFLVLVLDFGAELARLLDHGFRPDVRDIVAAQRNVDLHARRHVVADHLDHIALGLEARGWPVGDLHLDELADLRTAITPGGHQHFLLDLRVVWRHETDAAFFVVAADHAFVAAGDDLDDDPFAAATAVDAAYPCQGAVAIEHQAHLRRAEEQVFAAVIGNQEAEAIAVARDATEDQVQLVYRGISAAPGIDQLAITLHGAQTPTQGFDLVFGGQAELRHQLLSRGWFTAVGELLQDQLTAGDGVVVFFRFTCGLGIEGLPIGHQ
ncbi:MAG: hypothetical protein K0S77_1701 [Pseudomonas sp.]|nr:hypothetical protein [Pseudomonas sp.]